MDERKREIRGEKRKETKNEKEQENCYISRGRR